MQHTRIIQQHGAIQNGNQLKDFIMVAIPCLNISDSEKRMAQLDVDLAIEIQCGPHYKTQMLNQSQSTAVRFTRYAN